MKKRSTPFVVLIAALILTACGGTTPAAPTAAPAAPAPTAAPAAPEATAAPAAEATAAPAAAEATAAPAPEATAAPAASGEPITINFVMCCVQDDTIAFNKVIEAWHKAEPKYDNVTINLELTPFQELFPKIETAVASGAVLDLFQADGPDIKHYAYNKVIVPLDKYFTKEELAAFVPINVEAGTYKGTFYSPGIMESCSLMFYNKDMTDAAGIKPPETLQGWTMDEALTNWRMRSALSRSGSTVMAPSPTRSATTRSGCGPLEAAAWLTGARISLSTSSATTGLGHGRSRCSRRTESRRSSRGCGRQDRRWARGIDRDRGIDIAGRT